MKAISAGLLVSLSTTLALSSALAVDDEALFDLPLEELVKVEIKSDITSIKSKPVREQPGIVTVIGAQEIRDCGARDLSDVLMLVPGFALDTDVESVVGLTFRGLQGQEGKVLLIVDGIEVNEPLYGSLPILHHIPAETIQQVEIIRGPGSAMYGGTAGLAVVRVTTRSAGRSGGYAVVTPSYADGRMSWNYSLGLTYVTNDWRISFNGGYSETFISNRKYISLNGTSVDMVDLSDMYPLFLDVGVGYRGLDIRLICDLYRYDDAVYYGEPPQTPVPTRFDSWLAAAKYTVKPVPWLSLTPALTYRRQVPWYDSSEEVGDFEIVTERYQAELNGTAELSDASGLKLGVRFQRDSARAVDVGSAGSDAAEYYNGDSTETFDDIAAYAQYDVDMPWANLSAGCRYEHHDAVGGNVVPRVAITRAWDRFHVKALFSEAARIPSINVEQAAMEGYGTVDVERTANYELEAGYKFTKALSAVGSMFYMRVRDPILYTAYTIDNVAVDGYYNATNMISTYGLAAELRWDTSQVSAHLNYSFYRAYDNDVDYLRGDDNRFLAAPAHKVSFSTTWRILRSLDWNVSGFWLGKRMAYAYPAEGVTELDSEFVLNSFLNYRFQQFSLGIGVANLLDEDRLAPQPYAGESGPIPLKGREVFARLAVEF